MFDFLNMMNPIDKRDRAQLFRARVTQAMAEKGLSRAELARRIAVDRSTVTQILQPDTKRLPNAQVVGECAAALGVSADWLLGLSDRPERAADVIAAALTMTEAPRALVDEKIFAWHQEAAGYKIRHVPATLPDMLKTDAVLMWEYEPSLGRTTEQAVNASRDRLNWMRSAQSDYEIAFPMQELGSFARAEGYYVGLSAQTRRDQIDHLLALHDQLYPRLRIFLYDAQKLYSAPITIFGPLLAVLYLGRNYLAFRDKDRIGAITHHFDVLVKEAEVASRGFPAVLRQLRDQID
jgi:transcriptional regulator with XRE-family HTH domain